MKDNTGNWIAACIFSAVATGFFAFVFGMSKAKTIVEEVTLLKEVVVEVPVEVPAKRPVWTDSEKAEFNKILATLDRLDNRIKSWSSQPQLARIAALQSLTGHFKTLTTVCSVFIVSDKVPEEQRTEMLLRLVTMITTVMSLAS